MIDLNSSRINISIRDVLYKTETNVLTTFIRRKRHSNGFVFYIKGGHHHRMEKGEEYTAQDYDLLFLPYNSNYESQVLDPAIEYYQINFELFENGEKISLFDKYRLIHSPDTSKLLHYFLEIYNLYTAGSSAYKIRALSHLLSLISILVCEQDEEYSKTAARKRITPVLSYIDANYSKNTDVKSLADMLNLSVSGLEKNFIKAVGMTPVAYRNSIRIEHAKTLLLGGFSISDVWERVGYSDLYYFAKSFKKQTGISPGKFAKKGTKINDG